MHPVPFVAFLGHGPGNLRAAYERDVDRALALPMPADVVTDADLAALPEPVRRYLHVTGAVGQPCVHNFRARMHGRIRSGREARWMPLSAEQYNFIDDPARLFYLTSSMFMVPVQGYHRYVGPSARMTIKAAGFIPLADASGPEMDRTETVTLFNDMCMMAPATLISPAVAWDAIDTRRAGATFTNAGHAIRAELWFNDAGELVNFWSDDRYQTSPDGRRLRAARWSTPLAPYRSFGCMHLSGGGEARWHEDEGDYAYIDITLDTIDYNVGRRAAASPA